jgi:hypothetical protein
MNKRILDFLSIGATLIAAGFLGFVLFLTDPKGGTPAFTRIRLSR